jgi:glutathione S-transferase
MATSASASAVIPLPVHTVWNQLRDFTFPKRLLPSQILDVTCDDGSSQRIGVVRKMKWKTGEERSSRLLEVSELTKTVRWELIESVPESEVTAAISSIRLLRDTERNYTIVEWHTEFSSDCTPELIKFEQKSLEENLRELRISLTGEAPPVLYHLHQGPSTRIVWLAHELGFPLDVKEVQPTNNLRQSQHTERSLTRGGMVTTLEHGDLRLLESGAILMHLLDRFDTRRILNPTEKSNERAIFYKFLFYCGTVDLLVFTSYKEMFVNSEADSNKSLIQTNEAQWHEEIALEFERQLEKQRYICGDTFSGADIMMGWVLFTASLLGWLDKHPTLQQYLARLSSRPAFQRAFLSQ